MDQAKASVRSTGATTFTVTPEGYDWLGKAYFGYRFAQPLALEAGYWHFGGPSYLADIAAPTTASYRRDFKARGFGIGLAYESVFSNSFSTLIKLGAMRVSSTASATPAVGGLTPLEEEKVNQWKPHIATALRYRMTEAFAARAEYEFVPKVGNAATFGQANINAVSVGLEYGF